MHPDFVKKVMELYDCINAVLPKFSGNFCGNCYECCKAANVKVHRISKMELDYLEATVHEIKMQPFIEFITRKKDLAGKLLYSICPFFKNGCLVYPSRPLSCRMFGAYIPKRSHMIDNCPYKKTGIYFNEGSFLETIPYAKEFKALMDEYKFYTPVHLVKKVSPFSISTSQGLELNEIAECQITDPIIKAKLFHNKGNLDEALKWYLAAQRENPLAPESYYCSGSIYEEMGNKEKALESYQKAELLAPKVGLFHFRKGLLLEQMGRLDDAIDAYRQAILLQPDNSIAYGNTGFLLLDQNKMTDAKVAFEKAIKLDPENPFFFLGLGILQIKQNNFEFAEDSLCRALELDQKLNDAWGFLAVVYRHLGKEEKMKHALYQQQLHISD